LGWWRTCKWRVGGGMPIYIYLSLDWTETCKWLSQNCKIFTPAWTEHF
jgi:hypothetical protein